MIKTKYWLSVLALSVVLLTGSLAINPIAIADGDDDDDDDDDKKKKKGAGAEIPISLGLNNLNRKIKDCPDSSEGWPAASGAVVLLSDGTVKIPSAAGGFKIADLAFGSLPAGVWHDIEGSADNNIQPEGCFAGEPRFEIESMSACAVADTGDVFCVSGFVNNGVFNGKPWTFAGNALS